MLNEYQTQTELNPKLWDGDELKPKLKLGLLKIARAFYKSLGIDAEIKDVTLTGSNANYNWSRHSDLDLHLIINYKDINDNEILVKELMNAKKSLWNNKYPLKYKGMNIELYAQDTNEPHASTGVYSLFNSDWVTKPNSQMVSIDDHAIKRKSAPYKYEIDKLEKDDPKLLDKIASIKSKLKQLRKSGLDAVGEYSLENLAFKDLRNSGHLQQLNNLQQDSMFSQLRIIESSLPIKLKDIQKVKNIELAPDATEVEKDMWNHHHIHPGTADSMAEPDTYDFDDDTESDPGIQYNDPDDEEGGYEPVDESFGEEHDYSNYGGPWGTGHKHKTNFKKGPGGPEKSIHSDIKQMLGKDKSSTGYKLVDEEKKKKLEPSLKLPPGKKIVLKADTEEHDRGLVVTWRKSGGYDIYYWYGDPKKAVPAELKGDGESMGDDIKKIYLGFHPSIDKKDDDE